MTITRIDIQINGHGKSYSGEPHVELVPHGIWEIDKVPGKTLCRVVVKATIENNDELKLDFIPDDPFIYRLIDTFCEAEYKNDEFKFNNPKLSERRPAQLEAKVRFLKEILNRWESELKKISNSGKAQLSFNSVRNKNIIPSESCHNCQTNDWWWREINPGHGEWLCNRCHPDPNNPNNWR